MSDGHWHCLTCNARNRDEWGICHQCNPGRAAEEANETIATLRRALAEANERADEAERENDALCETLANYGQGVEMVSVVRILDEARRDLAEREAQVERVRGLVPQAVDGHCLDGRPCPGGDCERWECRLRAALNDTTPPDALREYVRRGVEEGYALASREHDKDAPPFTHVVARVLGEKT